MCLLRTYHGTDQQYDWNFIDDINTGIYVHLNYVYYSCGAPCGFRRYHQKNAFHRFKLDYKNLLCSFTTITNSIPRLNQEHKKIVCNFLFKINLGICCFLFPLVLGFVTLHNPLQVLTEFWSISICALANHQLDNQNCNRVPNNAHNRISQVGGILSTAIQTFCLKNIIKHTI